MFANKAEFVAATQDAKGAIAELPVLVDAFARVFQGKYGSLFIVITALLILGISCLKLIRSAFLPTIRPGGARVLKPSKILVERRVA